MWRRVGGRGRVGQGAVGWCRAPLLALPRPPYIHPTTPHVTPSRRAEHGRKPGMAEAQEHSPQIYTTFVRYVALRELVRQMESEERER